MLVCLFEYQDDILIVIIEYSSYNGEHIQINAANNFVGQNVRDYAKIMAEIEEWFDNRNYSQTEIPRDFEFPICRFCLIAS